MFMTEKERRNRINAAKLSVVLVFTVKLDAFEATPFFRVLKV